MGVDSWYAFGPGVNEADVISLTDATVARGLKAAGYRYIWIDAWGAQRDQAGQLVADPIQWPHGIGWLVSYIHSRGLLAGIYTNAGTGGCHNGGSLGHYQQDVDQFAGWGIDAIKLDFCGPSADALDVAAYATRFATAITRDRPRRAMLFDLCAANLWWVPYRDSAWAAWRIGRRVATSWRTGTDLSWPGGVITWDHLLRNISADARHPGGPAGWANPDYLAPTWLTPAQAQAQFTMWAMLAAPMMVSADLASLPRAIVEMLTNRAVLAVSQDPLGEQARLVKELGPVQVWVRPLANRSRAVALLNTGPSDSHVSLSGRALGMPGPLIARDLWAGTVIRGRRISVSVPGTSAALFRVSKASPRSKRLPDA